MLSSSGWNQPTNQQLELQKTLPAKSKHLAQDICFQVFVAPSEMAGTLKILRGYKQIPQIMDVFQQVYFLWNMALILGIIFFFKFQVGTQNPQFFLRTQQNPK